MEYSACVTFSMLAPWSCASRTARLHGIDRVSFSFVSMRPRHGVVRFFKLGHKLASWRFTVRPEGA
jgi:hypothetical protein